MGEKLVDLLPVYASKCGIPYIFCHCPELVFHSIVDNGLKSAKFAVPQSLPPSY